MLFPPVYAMPVLRQKATRAYKRRRSYEMRRWAFAAIGGGHITVADAHVGCGWHHMHTYSSTIAKVGFVHRDELVWLLLLELIRKGGYDYGMQAKQMVTDRMNE
jgi:hypothetical protein